MNNQDEQSVNLGRVYVNSLASREAADRSVVPSEQVDALRKSLMETGEVVDRVTLFAAALNPLLVRLLEHLGTPGVLAEETTENADSLAKARTLAQAARGFLSHYEEEADFCAKFERLTRERLLRSAGVDPSDERAVAAYVSKMTKALVLTPGNPWS